MNPLIVFGFSIPGIIIIFLGRYIGNTGYVEILKQYDEKKNYNKEALTEYVRKLMKMTGMLTVIASLVSGVASLITKNEELGLYFLVFYVFVTVHYILKLRFSCRKFEIKEKK